MGYPRWDSRPATFGRATTSLQSADAVVRPVRARLGNIAVGERSPMLAHQAGARDARDERGQGKPASGHLEDVARKK